MNQKKKAVILYCLTYKGWSNKDFSKVAGISIPTMDRRMSNPETFSLREIRIMTDGVPLSPEQLKDLVS